MTKNEFIKLCAFYEVKAKYSGKRNFFALSGNGDPVAVKILTKVLDTMNIKEFKYL